MKLTVALLVLLMFGCVSIQKGDFSYHRFGNQQLNDVHIKYAESMEGVEIDAKVAQATSDSEIKSLLEQIVEMLKAIKIGRPGIQE